MKRNLKRSVSTFTTSFKSSSPLAWFPFCCLCWRDKECKCVHSYVQGCMLLWGFDYLNEMFLWWVTVMVAVISICAQNKPCVWLFHAQHLTAELIAQCTSMLRCDIFLHRAISFSASFIYSVLPHSGSSVRVTLHTWNSMHLLEEPRFLAL